MKSKPKFKVGDIVKLKFHLIHHNTPNRFRINEVYGYDKNFKWWLYKLDDNNILYELQLIKETKLSKILYNN